MQYRVVAPLILIKDHEGRSHHRYAGSLIESDEVSAKSLDHHLNLKMVESVGAQVPQASVPTVATASSDAVERPARAAAKEAWEAFAVSGGGFTPEEAAAATKQDLIAALS